MAKKSEWTYIKTKYKIYSNRKFNEIKNTYTTPESFEEKFKEKPYWMSLFFLNKTFKASDELVMQICPELKISKERCKWFCYDILKKNESEGDTCINANLVAKVLKENNPSLCSFIVDVIKNDEMFHYDDKTKLVSFEDTWNKELVIAKAIKDRVYSPIKTDMNWEDFTIVDGFELTDEQTELLKLICDNSIVMLNGSAGTGKTSAMKAMVKMLQDSGYTYTILAPTGIAAKRISQVTGAKATTIHKHLVSRSYIGDFLIIDEMSMVGVHLLGSLFYNLSDNTKIIFICDEAQLASISCGNIVQDIIDSGIVPIVKLTNVFRYGVGGIATVATDVRMGKPLSDDCNKFNDCSFIDGNDEIMTHIMCAYDGLREKYSQDEIMILSPFNVREAGTYAINSNIQSSYNNNETLMSYVRQSTEIGFKNGDKVVNTENNYHMQGEYQEIAVMNGDIGTVVGYDDMFGCLKVEFDNGIAFMEKNDVFKLLLGYSISVHKSQGTQAKAVIVVIDKTHSFFLSRNLLYVAMSRAQEKLIIIGDMKTINNALGKEENKERETMLKEMLIKQ